MSALFGIIDVGYEGQVANAGCLAVHDLSDHAPAEEWTVGGIPVDDYVPGEFWKRELRPLQAGIEAAPATLSVCVIDSYVDLGAEQTPGLGRILHELTGLPVIGVAKSPYRGTPSRCEVRRRTSDRPLFVTTAGYDLAAAKLDVVAMAGEGRIPSLLRRADRLSRRTV